MELEEAYVVIEVLDVEDDMFAEMPIVVGRGSNPRLHSDVIGCDSPGHVALDGQPDLRLELPIQRPEKLQNVVLNGRQRIWKKQV